jgi:ubiquinone/menaquinone biosynthesis C-methylase UbiE
MRKRVRRLLRQLASKLLMPSINEQLASKLVMPSVDDRLLPVDPRIQRSPYLTGKLDPFGGNATEYVVPPCPPPSDPLPVPPRELWLGYAETAEEYLACGRDDMTMMLAILRRAGQSPETLRTVLDFGCAAARMLRHYPPGSGAEAERWGVDINARHITWCQQNLSPPLRFATTTTAPHLPFEDNYFDLVYCGSVFTHISDLADAWLLELRRVLRVEGHAYVTIHDEHTLELVLTRYREHPLFRSFVEMIEQFESRTHVRTQEYAYFSVDVDPVSQVFYQRQYLLRKWSLFMDVVSVNPEAHDHQTAVLLRKRRRP